MKKLLMLLLPAFLCLSLCGQPQQIKIANFTVKNQLPANIDSWNNMPGSLLLVAQIPPGVRIPGIRLVVQIKSGGAVICGNNSTGGMQVDNFTTRTFSATELTGALTGCHELKDGSYTICVQFFNGERKEASQEMCKEFRVETPTETDFAPPTLITPENEKNFAEAELSRPVSFRWTPLVPKPREPVTYRLKVWQLMQGQNGTQAMRSNQPIVTKDVDNITQAVVSGIYTGPCRPPYLCDFIWQVQALNKEGKPMGRNEGNSEPYVFKIKQNVQGEFKNTFPENEKQFSASDVQTAINFRWTPLVPKPQEPVTYRLKVWQLMQGQNGSQAMRTNKPIVTKDVADITEAVVSGIYTGPCRPPYLCDFIWNVEATTRNAAGSEPHTISTSEPFVFSVKENETQPAIKNIFPENEKKFKPAEAIKPISFRWTPLVPKPQEPVTYRLKVWQLMQGQNGSQAMRTNKPIGTKDVADITEVVVSGIYTGPCRPPYLCDFVWNVQALNREGKPMGRNEGNSEPFVFKIADDNINTKIDSVDVSCCINNKQNVYIRISNLHLTNQAQVTAIKYRVNGTGPITTLSPTTPITPFTIPANSSQIFTGSINCIDSMKTIKFIVDAIWPSDPDNINNETAWDTLKCACDPCRIMGVTLKNDTLTTTASTSGQILLSGILNGLNPATVKKITIELIYFNIEQTGDSNCVKCAENKEWGNFIKPASSAFTGFGTGVMNGINFGREWTWLTNVQKDCDEHGGGHGGDTGGGTGNPTNPNEKCTTCGTANAPNLPNAPNVNIPNAPGAAKIANPGGPIITPLPIPKANSFSLPIAVPPGGSLKCCGDKIKVCIRYTVWDFCCHACDVIKCYTIERKAQ